MIEEFFKDRKVFITGHTGFKGSWLCKILSIMGADVTGFSIDNGQNTKLYNMCNANVNSIKGDIRDLNALLSAFKSANPEIVIHMAAQPIVTKALEDPINTYSINVLGTANLLECIRTTDFSGSVLNVTTDKVYANQEWCWGYRELDVLGGIDPYSCSKSCSELITKAYYDCYFKDKDISVTTVRAGNVIGGGDFAANRIIPDFIRSVINEEPLIIRNPKSIRPYQHVLEALFFYLLVVYKHFKEHRFDTYNIGPNIDECITTEELIIIFKKFWPSARYIVNNESGKLESNFLRIDSNKAKSEFDWKPVWSIETAAEKVYEWTEAFISGRDIGDIMDKQIKSFRNKCVWIS